LTVSDGVDPHPTPAHQLVTKSDALDAAMDQDPLFAGLRADQVRTRALAKRTMTLSVVQLVAGLVLVYALHGVAANASRLTAEKRARHVFCVDTNMNNAVSRVALVSAFPDAPDPVALQLFAQTLFPIRDCTKDPPIVIDTIAPGVIPAPPEESTP
jgi:hypothetical protein